MKFGGTRRPLPAYVRLLMTSLLSVLGLWVLAAAYSRNRDGYMVVCGRHNGPCHTILRNEHPDTFSVNLWFMIAISLLLFGLAIYCTFLARRKE